MPDKESEKIEIRSDEVQDILGMVPSWIVRWGTVVILLTVLAILVGSWFFSYPDIIRADIIVTTENPPSTLEAMTDGQIEDIFVDDNQFVNMHTLLAVINSTADHTDVISLKYDIEELRTIIPDFEKEEFIELDNNYELGDIQPAYTDFKRTYDTYQNFLELDNHARQILSLEEEIRGYQIHKASLQRQSNLLKQQLQIADSQFQRDSNVWARGQGLMADADYEKSRSAKIQEETKYEQSLANISSTDIEISKTNYSKLALELAAENEKLQKQSDMLAAFERLNAEIGNWEQKYMFVARIDGLVTFPGAWAENQNVNQGDKVLTIVPEEPGDTIGKINLPVEGSGKVEENQKVNIKFSNYPHLQYGMVRGIIRAKSQVPYDELYSVEVELPNGLITYYGDTIPFNQEMPGRAEIITDDRKLLERITSPIRSVLTEQREARETGQD